MFQSFQIIQKINVELYLHILLCGLNPVYLQMAFVLVHVMMHMGTRETTNTFLEG